MDAFNRNIFGEVLMTGKVMEDFKSLCILRTFKKNEIITCYSSIENYLNIVVEGQGALFYKDEGVDEFCFDINYPGEYISSYASYVSQTPSIFELRAISNLRLLSMSYANMYQKMYQTVDDGSRAGRQAVEAVFQYTQERMLTHYTCSASEKYERLLSRSKGMILQTPSKYIASYLGIRPQTLSKIKNELNK